MMMMTRSCCIVALLCAGSAVVATSGFDEAMTKTTDPFEKECLEYLKKWAPKTDLTSPNITASFLLENVQLAIAARKASPWASSVPKELFLNDVLPYAVLSEPRGLPDWAWRKDLSEFLLPKVSKMPNASAAAEQGVNSLVWQITNPQIVFKAAPNCQVNAYAPAQVIQQKFSSCTGLAVFVALALRSVGLPARVAGVPHWNKCGGQGATCATCPHGDICTPGDHSSDDACGNHDWAEVWADGRWHFMDPDGSKTLDNGWFQGVTKLQVVHNGSYLNHSVLASSWASTMWLQQQAPELYPHSLPVSHFAMVWDWQSANVPGWDVTPRYLL